VCSSDLNFDKLAWKYFNNSYGDLITIYYIYLKIKFLLISDYVDNNTYAKSYDTFIKNYYIVKNKFIIEPNKPFLSNLLKYNEFQTLQELDNKNQLKLTSKKTIENIKNIIGTKKKSHSIDTNRLELFASTFELDFSILKQIINNYNILCNKITDNLDRFIWFKYNLNVNKSNVTEYNIIKSFLHAFNTNILYHDYSNKQFYKLRAETITIFKYKYLFRSMSNRPSILDYTIKNFKKLLLYIGKEGMVINNIELEWLFECCIHVFNPYSLSYVRRVNIASEVLTKLINYYSPSYINNIIRNKPNKKLIKEYKILSNYNNLIDYYKKLAIKINQ
jgi:hypothetical protein